MVLVKHNFWHKSKKYTVGDTFIGKIIDEIKQFLEVEDNQQHKKTTKTKVSSRKTSVKK